MEIKELYQKAGELHHQAKAILDEFSGKEMPQEKAQQYDALMDEFDRLIDEAKRRERANIAEQELGQPANKMEAPKPPEAKTPGVEYRGVIYRSQPEVMKAWERYLKGGHAALGLAEQKALQADSDTAGGFLVAPQQFLAEVLKAVDNLVFIRQLATVHVVPDAASLGVATMESDVADPDWTTELATGTEDTSLDFGKRELRPHPLAKYIKVSKTLIAKVPNVEALVRDRLAYKFAVAQENAFLNGDGTRKPLGVFTASDQGISTSYDVTAAAATSIAADDLINCKHALKPQYWPRARWVLHRDVLKAIRKLKDANNQYLWQPGLSGDLPSAILDVPYVVSEYAPSSIAASQYVAIIGDFSKYWIADAMPFQLQVATELYIATNQNGYFGRMETDGMPVIGEAFRRLKMAAS